MSAFSTAVASTRPSAILVTTLGLLIAGAASMALGELMSVTAVTDAEDRKGLTVTASPLLAAGASATAFASGAAIPGAAAILSPPDVRILVVLGASVLALALSGYLGGRLAGIPPYKQIARLVCGGVLAIGITYGITRLVAG